MGAEVCAGELGGHLCAVGPDGRAGGGRERTKGGGLWTAAGAAEAGLG
jgi:hypothetical protein